MRTTAAKQLAQLAAKSVISDVVIEEDVKYSHRHHVPLGDMLGWTELMAVIARVYTLLFEIILFRSVLVAAGPPIFAL